MNNNKLLIKSGLFLSIIIILLVTVSIASTAVYAQPFKKQPVPKEKLNIFRKNTNNTTNTANVKTRADNEINRRIAELNKLITNIKNRKRLSDDNKTRFISQIQAQIDSLNSLKSKIDAETDETKIMEYAKTIFSYFRIYELFKPKEHILVSADIMAEAADNLSILASKLQTNLDNLKQKNIDTSNFISLLSEMQSKIAESRTDYTNAVNLILPLSPDMGDKNIQTQNKAAINNARNLIKNGSSALKTARNDARKIKTEINKYGFK